MNLSELLHNEKSVKKLEIIAGELKKVSNSRKNKNFKFLLPMLFVIFEQLRTSNTPFPKKFF